MLQIVTIGIGYPNRKNFLMKKIFTTLFMLIGIACLQADASMIVVDYQGDTAAYQQTVERHLVMNSDDSGIYDIAIRPLDDALRSVDGKVAIPLRYVFINNNREDVYMRYNEYSNIFKSIRMGGIPQNMTARVKDFGMVPAGIYTMNFEVQATDVNTHEIACTSNFNLQLKVPTVQNLSLNGELPIINVGANDVLKKNQKIVNQNSPMIYINSNTDWVLSIKTDNFDNSKADYYIRTIGASSNVTQRLQEKALITPGKEIILARGKAPANNQFLTVEYSIETRDGECIKAGNYENRLRYVLREDRG